MGLERGVVGGSLPDPRSQLRVLWPTFLTVGGIMVAFGMVILIVYATTHVNVHHLVADPAEIAALPEYTGIYSHIGILTLWAAAVVAIVTSIVAARPQPHQLPAAFLRSLSALLALLAVDDLLMLHEWAGLLLSETSPAREQDWSRSQLEAVVFAVIGILWLLWLIRFRRVILRTDYLLLAAAILAFGASVAIDLGMYVFPSLDPETLRWQTTVAVLEEMAKLTGIILLFAYTVRMCMGVIHRAMGETGRATSR